MTDTKTFALAIDGHGFASRAMTAHSAQVVSGVFTCEAEDFVGGLIGGPLQDFWRAHIGSLATWAFGPQRRDLLLLEVGDTIAPGFDKVELTFAALGPDESLGDAGRVLITDPVVYLSQPVQTELGSSAQTRRPSLVTQFSESIGQRAEIKGGIASVDGLSVTLLADPKYEAFLARSTYPAILDDDGRPLEITTLRGKGGVGSLDLQAPAVPSNDANGDPGVSIGGATWYLTPYVGYVDDEAVVLLGYNETPDIDGNYTFLTLRGTILTETTLHPPLTVVWNGCPTPIGQFCRVGILDVFDPLGALSLISSPFYRGVVDNAEWTADLTAFSLEISSVLLGVYATRLQGRQSVTLTSEIKRVATLGASYLPENNASTQALYVTLTYPDDASTANTFQWVSDGKAVYRLHDSDTELTYTRPVRGVRGGTTRLRAGAVYEPREDDAESEVVKTYTLCPIARFYPAVGPNPDTSQAPVSETTDFDHVSAVWTDFGSVVTSNIFRAPGSTDAGAMLHTAQADTLAGRRYDTTIFGMSTVTDVWALNEENGGVPVYQPRLSIVHWSLLPRIEPNATAQVGPYDAGLTLAHVFEPVAVQDNDFGAPEWLRSATDEAGRTADLRFTRNFMNAVNGAPAYVAPPGEDGQDDLGTVSIHVCDALLQLLTSTGYFRRSDMASPATVTGPNGRFDRLPYGVGFAVPESLIDFDSFSTVAEQARVGGADLVVTNLILTGEDMDDLLAWMTDTLLEPFSLLLVQGADGRLRLIDVSFGATITGAETAITDTLLRGAPRAVPLNGDRRLTENIASGIILKNPALAEWCRLAATPGGGPEASRKFFSYAPGSIETTTFNTSLADPSFRSNIGLRTALFQKVQSQPISLELKVPVAKRHMGAIENKIRRFLYAFNRVNPVIEVELPARTVNLGDTVLVTLSNWIDTTGEGPLTNRSGIVLDLKQSVLTQTDLVTIIIVPEAPTFLEIVWAGSALVVSYSDPVITVNPTTFQSRRSIRPVSEGLFLGSRVKLYDQFFTLRGEGSIAAFDPDTNELTVTWDSPVTPAAGDVITYGDVAGSPPAADSFAVYDRTRWR